MAREFRVNILLDIVTKGLENVSSLFANLTPSIDATTSAAKEARREFEKFTATDTDRLVSGFEAVKAKIKELQAQTKTDDTDKLIARLSEAQRAFIKAFGDSKAQAGALNSVIEDLFGNMAAESKKAAANVVSNLNTIESQLKDIKIGGLESFERLQDIFKRLREGANIRLDLDTATAIEETKALERNLTTLLKEAEQGGDFEGFQNLSNISKSIRDARAELERLVKEAQNLEAKPIEVRARLAQEFPKVKAGIKEFNDQLEKSKQLGISADFVDSGAGTRLNALLTTVRSLRNDAKRIGEDTVKFDVSIAEIVRLKDELNFVGKQKDRITRDAISIRVSNATELKNLEADVRKLLVQLEKAKQAGNIKLVAELDVKRQDLAARLEAIRQPINDLKDKTKIELFEGVANKLQAAQRSVQTFGSEAADQAQKVQAENIKTTESISRIITEARRLATETKKASKEGATIDQRGDLVGRADALKASIAELERASTLTVAQFDKLTKAKVVVDSTSQAVKNLTEENVRSNEAIKNNIATLSSNFQSAKDRIREVAAEIKKAATLGNATEIKPKVTADLDSITEELRRQLDEAKRLGQNTTPIRLQLENVEKVRAQIDSLNEDTDRLAKRKIDIRIRASEDINEVVRELRSVNKELDEAIKKGDTRVILKLQADITDLTRKLGRVRPLVDELNEEATNKLFAKARSRIGTSQTRLNELKDTVPSGLTGTLRSAANAFRLAAADAGGLRGATTGAANALRLAGTSAFVVGGQLRTLGFAFTALASIMQNLAPVILQFTAGLVKAGPAGLAIVAILTGIGTTAAVVAGKLALVVGGLGALVETGFEYNSALEQTRNASAALGQEFFNFFVNGEKVNETIEVGGKVLSKYQIAQQAVENQFAALQTTALTTIFTNRELLGTFQNIILASKGLAPSLESVTNITGQFARVAGLIGISADKLASQVNLVLSGTGRVTSPLQRFLNAAKDSEGIELTAKRIRQLRAEGGDVLFAELSTAINKFDEALKQANRSSFAGVLSNFKDVFEQISQLATRDVFATLRDNLANTVDSLTQRVPILKDDGSVLTNKAGETQFNIRPSKELLGIAQTADKIFKVIAADLIKLVNFLLSKLGDIDKFLKDNYNNLIRTYDTAKNILKAVLDIAAAFVRVVTGSANTNSQLETMLGFFDGITIGLQVFRASVSLIGAIINGIVGGVAFLPELFLRAAAAAARFKDEYSPFGDGKKTQNTKDLEAAAEAATTFRQERFRAFFDNINDVDEATTEGADLLSGKTQERRRVARVQTEKEDQRRRVLENFESRSAKLQKDRQSGKISQQEFNLQRQNLDRDLSDFKQSFNKDLELRLARKEGLDLSRFEPKLDITSQGTGRAQSENEEKNRRQRNTRSEIADRKAVVDEIRKLGIQREQNELKLTQDRLRQEEALSQAALDQNLISQQQNSKKILDIKNQEINNELTTRRNAIELLNAERIDKEQAFQAEVKNILDNAGRTKEPKAVTQSKLDVLDLKQSTELLANARERVRLEGEIQALTQSRNEATLTYLVSLQNTTKELRNQVIEQKKGIDSAIDVNSEESIRFKLLDAVQDKIEQIIQTNKQIETVSSLIGTTEDKNTSAILQRQLKLLQERKNLFEQEIEVRRNLIKLQASQNLADELKNNLAISESERSLKVAQGLQSERQALIEATAERIKYKQALLEALEAQENIVQSPVDPLSEKGIANAQRRNAISRLKQEINELKTVIDDSELINATNSIRDNFVSLFDDIQDGSKGAAQSFADLGKSILGTFRNLISRRITEELFGSLFPTQGQTQGKVTGFFGKIFSAVGLGRAEDQAKAEQQARTDPSILTEEQRKALAFIKQQANEGGIGLKTAIEELTRGIEEERLPFELALRELRLAIEKAGFQIADRLPDSAKTEAAQILQNRPRISNATEEVLFNTKKPQSVGRPATTGVSIPEVAKAPSITTPEIQGVGDKLKTALAGEDSRTISAITNAVDKITATIATESQRVKQVNLVDSGNLLPNITQYFSALRETISVYVGSKLDEIISLLTNAGSVSVDQSSLGLDGEGFNRGGKVGYISGGAVKGSGGIREDSIPARLSNGEYVIQSPIVSKMGVEFFDYLNKFGLVPGMARGGRLLQNTDRPDYVAPIIDPTKFNYIGGGASLINKPAPIVEQPKPAQKKPGRFRRLLGGLLSFAAPFLGLIPGVGGFLSLGAGALGGVLSGNNARESIVGGLLGGLGNLGGFSKSGGSLGKLSKFFGTGGGKFLTSILGSSVGNSGTQAGAGGQGLLAILQKLGIFNKKSGGGIVGLAAGGFLNIFSSLGSVFSKVFGKLGGLGKLGGSKAGASGNSGGGLDKLLLLFGLSSALGKIGQGGSQEQFEEVEVEDPDAERKNRFGSAFNPLVDQGLIPAFKYSDETLQKLIRQQEGFRNLVKLPKQGGFLKGLLGLLPFLGGLFGGGKSGNKGTLVDSPLPFKNPLGNVFASTGGLIQAFMSGGKVKGAGTGTSDSIPALLSNGEYVIKASSVRSLGTDILDSINEGRLKFANGGIVGSGVATLPDSNPVSVKPEIKLDGSVTIANFIDPSLFDQYLDTSQGKRKIVNTIRGNKKAVRSVI